jgi:hypothetical protein
MWLHASPSFLAEGSLVSPPGALRVPRWPGAEQAERMGWYRRDRVCVFWSDETVPVSHHIDRFEFVTRSTYVYEVEPIGDLEDDQAPGGHESWRCCIGARVLRCHLWPTR